jgi:hypothetical protein
MINASIFLKKIADKYLPSLRVGINIDSDRAQKILNFMAEYRLPELINFLDILVLTSETLQNDYHLVFLVNVVYLFEFYCHISVSKGNLVIPIFTAESWFTRISSLGKFFS